MSGQNGNDQLNGGGGADTLTGETTGDNVADFEIQLAGVSSFNAAAVIL